MASASSMPSLGQKQDLKSLLECSICLETFDDPRTLPCLHSFCKKCLEDFVEGKHKDELNCPVCRCKFALNEGVAEMTRNHFICNMVEVLSIQDQDKCIPCSHCQQASVGRCVTCELFMCEKCLQSHNGYVGFRDHVVLTIEELSRPENRSKIKGKSYCKKHSGKKLKLYCETCEELICTYCVVFEHVRPDHVCSPLDEIAERKREELKTICQTLENNESHSTELYDGLAITSCYLDNKLEEVKSHIHKRKNSVLKCIKDIVERKAQSLIEKTENTARVKKQTIHEELKKVSEHKVRQRKAYDTAKALIENGSNEEIMLSHKSVQQSVENGAKEYERQEIDSKLPEYDDEKLDNMFFNEIKTSKRQRLISTSQMKHEPPQRCDQLTFGRTTGKLFVQSVARSNPDSIIVTPQNPKEKVQRRMVFDPSTGKLVCISNAGHCTDNAIAMQMATTGFVCGPVDE